MITGLNHLTMAVKDLERSFAFYRDVLGFKPLMRHKRGAYFLAGDLWFCLDLDGATRADVLPEYTQFAFGVASADFAAVSARIVASGARLWRENKSEGDSLYFLDPDGHKLELHVGSWQSRLADAKKRMWGEDMEFFV